MTGRQRPYLSYLLRLWLVALDTLVTPSAVNHAPVAQDQSVTTDEDQSVTTDEDKALAITLAATDADNDALTYSVVSQPAHGTLSGTAPNLTYTPNTGYVGSDSFTFKANDGKADAAPLRNGGMPIPGQGTDLRVGCEGQSGQGDGQGDEEPTQAVRRADLDEVQAEAT